MNMVAPTSHRGPDPGPNPRSSQQVESPLVERVWHGPCDTHEHVTSSQQVASRASLHARSTLTHRNQEEMRRRCGEEGDRRSSLTLSVLLLRTASTTELVPTSPMHRSLTCIPPKRTRGHSSRHVCC
eukprot:3904760-Rhodomonas_salina.1